MNMIGTRIFDDLAILKNQFIEEAMLSNEIVSNFVPLFDRILVRKLRPQAVSKGGVHLPLDATQESIVKAEVSTVW